MVKFLRHFAGVKYFFGVDGSYSSLDGEKSVWFFLGVFWLIKITNFSKFTLNIGYPSATNYVDAKDNTPLGWDGDFGDVGGNRGIWDYAETNHYRGFMGKFE